MHAQSRGTDASETQSLRTHGRKETYYSGYTFGVDKSHQVVPITDNDLDVTLLRRQEPHDGPAEVQEIENVTRIWSPKTTYIAYGFIFLIFSMNSLQQGITGALTPYVTSSFQKHSLTAMTGVFSNIIGGLVKLPLAKVLDIWGRPQGFLAMLFVQVAGLVMMAACNNVETYAAAQVFYWVGQNGISYSLDVFIADTSALKNRGLMFAFTNAPYIVTIWIGGRSAEGFVQSATWRWAFGTFAIITPVIAMPLFFILSNYQEQPVQRDIVNDCRNHYFAFQIVRDYAIEFDIIGLILLASGLALVLLPCNIYSFQAMGWHSPLMIGMLLAGSSLIVSFGIYERSIASKSFMPWYLLTDKTVLGAFLLSALLFMNFYIWDSYFYSTLVVVFDQSVAHATYIANIYTVGTCIWGLVTGLWLRTTGRLKQAAFCFGVPLSMVGVLLMVHFRRPETHIGWIVFCQIIISIGGGTLVICGQMAALAASKQQHTAIVLAMQSMFAALGAAVGDSVASAIWTTVFPKQLGAYLPVNELKHFEEIYGSIEVQRRYLMGSPTRTAINNAYGDAIKIMMITSVCVMVLAFAAVMSWRDIRIDRTQQDSERVV